VAGNGSGSGFEVPGGGSTPSAPAAGGNVGSGSGFETPGGGAAPHGGGGGGFFHDLGHVITAPAHWVGTKLDKGGSDVKQIVTGLYDVGKVAVHPGKDPNVGKEWSALLSGHPRRMWDIASQSPGGRANEGAISALTKGQYESLKGVAEHPLRDPFMDALWLSPASHLAAKGGLEGLGRGALLDTPRMIAEPGRRPVSLFTSKNAARRLVQAGIDRATNHALANDRSSGFLGHEGPVAAYGRSRMGGTLAEIGRARIRVRQAMIASTRVAGRQVGQFAKSVGHEVENPQLVTQALLHALHDNQLPEHEAIFHEQQAAKGINPEQNTAWANAFNDAGKLQVVKLGADDRVSVDENHPLAAPLAKADAALEKLGAYGEDQLIARGLREPHDLADRNTRVSQLVQRGRPLTEEPQPLKEARRSVVNVQKRLARSHQLEQNWMDKQEGRLSDVSSRVGGRSVDLGSPHREKIVTLGHQLEAAHQRLTSLEDRYGFSSQERRDAIQQGIRGREELHTAAHSLFPTDAAAAKLEHIEQMARQYARSHDVTPHEFYARFLRHTETPHEIAPGEADLLAAWSPHGPEDTEVLASELGGPKDNADLQQLEAEKQESPEEKKKRLLAQSEGHIQGSYSPTESAVRLSSEHATPETLLHEGMHAVRQSFSPAVEEIARRQYAPQGWTREAEEGFVNDMLKAAHGEEVSPLAQRIYNMTSHWIEGRGYVPMSVWEDMRQSHSPMAAATGKVIGTAKNPMETHFATGEATAQGLRRTDVAESVTAHWQKMMRFFNTLDHRELAAQHGGDTRLSSDDTLVRYDRRTEAGMKLPADHVGPMIKEALDILENKTGLPAPEEEGLSAGVSEALRETIGHIFPRLGSDPELLRLEHTAEVGTAAPAGYKWVPQQIAKLKDLEAAVTARESNPVGRFADNVNGAVTAATVYYKIGHVFTRVFTNAATNAMQGSLRPSEIAESWDVFHQLTPDEVQEGLAYAGTHYYEAAPGSTGGTAVGRSMQKGLHVPFTDKALRTKSGAGVMSPQWWAHHVDAPFRFNSIAFEARRAGYEGADGFRQFLSDVRDYNTLDDMKRAEVDGILRRSDREAIAYDRQNQFEKRFLMRAVWFYPWIKGSTVFTANTWLEHPFKAASLGALGQEGAAQSDRLFGDMPSYAHGLTELHGGSLPVVSDFNTFNPFSTAADLIGTPEHIGNVGGMLNPVYGAGVGVAESINPYGAHTANPVWDNLKGLLSSAPEYQIGASALDHGDQSHRLYPGGHGLNPLYKNWLGELVRALGSPATPRHVNPESGHSLAQRERTGR
jgi:hypothetical protein